MNTDPVITRVTPRRLPLTLCGLLGLLLVLLLAGIGTAKAQATDICRVTTTGSAANDGSSWGVSMDLQSALATTRCTEIWVAAGVYHPVTLANPAQPTPAELATSFAIPAGVAVYGGFAGTETSRAERDPQAHVTVLSGDLTDADTTNADGVVASWQDLNQAAPHSQTVVSLTGTASAPITVSTVLDGFVITAGMNASSEATAAAGLACSADGSGATCSPTLSQLVLQGNSAMAGGGMSVAAANAGTASPSLANILLQGNQASTGGGMAIVAGGAGSTASPQLARIAFIGNSAGNGALANVATSGGTANATLENVTFSGNSGQGVGAIFNYGIGGTANPVLTNVTFHANSGTQQADAVINASTDGGTAVMTFHNVIVWPGTATGTLFYTQGTASMSFDHAIVQGGCPSGASCTGVSAADPLLGALGDHGGFTPTLLPGAGSPAIDAGDACASEDQRGHARPSGPACDLGAVEVAEAGVSVTISGAHGTVTAWPSPPTNGPALDCGNGGSVCTAWYGIEAGAAAVRLVLTPDAGYVVTQVSGCGGSAQGGHYLIPALSTDCTVNVTFALETHTIGGTVTGLAGSGLALALNGGAQTLAVPTSGSFTFATALEVGVGYAVSITNQPTDPNQTCVVINGAGTVGHADIDNIVVNCGAAATYSVGGMLSGLAVGESITLAVNGGNPVTLSADGAWAFPVAFASGAGYTASITAQPQGQHCTLTNATGTVGNADVTNLAVDCAVGGPDLHLSVSDSAAYAAYGSVRDYLVTLTNNGNGTANDVAVSASFDPALDAANTQWICINGAPDASCTAQGAGGFSDSAKLPPGASLVWIVSVPVHTGSPAASATFTVHADGASDAADSDTLVIFRDGLDVPYGTFAVPAMATPGAVLAGRASRVVPRPLPTGPGVGVLARLQDGATTVLVQRIRVAGSDYVRLNARADGRQHLSHWARVLPQSVLVLGSVAGPRQQRILLLEGAATSLQVTW